MAEKTYRMVSARQLIGRKIVGFDPCPFDDGRGGRAHEPTIYLDDGSRLKFVTEETDIGEYGVFVMKVAKEPTTHAHQ